MPHDDAHHHSTLSRAVRTIFSVTLLSRFGGLARDVIIGRLFGNSVLGSSFQTAFQIPNLFRRLLGEGTLSAAFIPAYTNALKDPSQPGPAHQLASLTLATLGLVSSLLTILGEIGLLLALLLLPRDPERDLSLKLIMVMLPFMPFICIAAILTGILQVHHRFGPASSGPLTLNLFISATGIYFLATGQLGSEWVAYVLCVATVLSGLTQCLWFFRLLRAHVAWTRHYAPAVPAARAMFRRFVPVAIGLGTLQLNTFIDTLIAMYPIWVGGTIFGFTYPLDGASNSVLSLTSRLYQFPLGVFGIAVATAVFPLLARTADDPERFAATLRRGVRLSLFIGVPASVGLVLIRHDITYVMFAGGNSGFDAVGVAKSAAVLAGQATGIWAYSLNHVLARVCYAKGDTVTPMKIATAVMGVNLVLNLTLIWSLQEAGMAWATSIAAALQCVILSHLVRRRLLTGHALFDAPTRAALAKVLLAATLMGAGVYAALALLPVATTWTTHLLGMLVGTALGGGLYLGAGAVLRMEEPGWLLRGK